MNKIKVAVVGVGNCASSLIQGVEYYRRNPSYQHGIMFSSIGGYSAEHIEFVIGFDVDERKVGKHLSEAIYALPNCTMDIMPPDTEFTCISEDAVVERGPVLDGIAPHMRKLPPEISFVESTDAPINKEKYQYLLKEHEVDVLLNYLPVGSTAASKWYIENAIECGVNIVNCMPTYISTDDAKSLEKLAIEHGVTVIGSDMRSDFGASRLSEVLQGAILDSGLHITQHIQENKASGYTQGKENTQYGCSGNTDFLNMALKERLHDKHVSKENVLSAQNIIRNKPTDGLTLYAGPSLSVIQRPGGQYQGSDTKVANIDIIAWGWGGAKYELTARLVVQDSPNSAGIVYDAIRYCKVAREMNIRGYLRGPSAWTQKSPPVHLPREKALHECIFLANRVYTEYTKLQAQDEIDIDKLEYTMQSSKTEYEK